ncbi:MAG: SDR family NAD(P)-dependent oxidoreductase [Proteobacteria bacterium]|nr:SDR family NAD(P)-dependent oxidoreductase [Pseudomonadota bacterium]
MSSGGARRALITGAASGLGKSLALRFAADGWRVAVCDLDEDRVRLTAEEIDEAGGTGMSFRADVTSEEEIQHVAESVSDRWGGLDVLVNNAGIATTGRTDETSMEEWRRIFEVNFFGVLRTTQVMLPLIARGGHIINVASFAGIAAAPGVVAYNTTKAAVISFSESLRAELIEKDIGVSVTCPSFFKTRLMETSGAPHDKTRAMVERFMERSKVTAEDVAEQMFVSVRTRQFMLIPHADARWFWRWKRFFPEWFFKGMKRMARPTSRPENHDRARQGQDVG